MYSVDTPITMFSKTPTNFYANIISAWLSVSITIILALYVGDYEMISASTLLFVIIFAMALYMNGYYLILKLNAGIELHHMKFIKFIPILAILMYEGSVLRDLIYVLSDKENIIATLRVYNINNYKMNYQVLDADYAYSLLKKVGIISYITHVFFTGFIVSKLWIEENKITNIVEWNRSVLAYSKKNSRSAITNVDVTANFGENVYSICFWISMAKFSYILLEPLMLFSVVNLEVLPSILFTLFIDSGKEIYIISCINMGFVVATLCLHRTKMMQNGNMYLRMIIINLLVLSTYLYWCQSKQYDLYEFIKVENYGLTYTGVYSIIINLYIYQVCNIHYIVKRDYEYETIPTSESTMCDVCDVCDVRDKDNGKNDAHDDESESLLEENKEKYTIVGEDMV